MARCSALRGVNFRTHLSKNVQTKSSLSDIYACSIRSEHNFGTIKGRWASLRELCLNIDCAKAYSYATDWVLARCVLQNVRGGT